MATINDWYNETTVRIDSERDGKDFEGWHYGGNYDRIYVKYGFGYDAEEVTLAYNPDTQEWTER